MSGNAGLDSFVLGGGAAVLHVVVEVLEEKISEQVDRLRQTMKKREHTTQTAPDVRRRQSVLYRYVSRPPDHSTGQLANCAA